MVRDAPGTLLLFACLAFFASGCYGLQKSSGGGQTTFTPPRTTDPSHIALPNGYQIEVVATGLTFPTGVLFDDVGSVFVIESGYAYGEAWTVPRLIQVSPDGLLKVIAEGDRNGPWNGGQFFEGAFYVAEGGQIDGGRILRIFPDGQITPLVEDLPGMGDHHVNGLAISDGWVYFSQGTATNSAVVGEDNADFGWLERWPEFHDIPCEDITLAGENFASTDVLSADDTPGAVYTGAFSPFGTVTSPGQIVSGQVPCHGAIMRIPIAGGRPEVVAWGFRNPFGLAFSPEGTLYATDNGYDDRGSRPVWGAPDFLWKVDPGEWYGWPDFVGQRALTPILAEHPGRPPPPAAVLAVHSSSNGLDFSTDPQFGHVGQAFIAQFGDMAPETGKVMGPVGFKVVRVDVETGVVHDFAVNVGRTNGPASLLDSSGLERPVAVKFTPAGSALYVVDFGLMRVVNHGAVPHLETGVLWRITKSD